MENLLLVFDELDDLYSMAGLVWRPVVSFLSAVALFVGTGFLFLMQPVVIEVLAFTLVGMGLLDIVRRRAQSSVTMAQD